MVDFLFRWLDALKVPFHHDFVDFDNRFDQSLMRFVDVDQIGFGICRIQDVDDLAEVLSGCVWNVEQHALATPQLLKVVSDLREVNIFAVQFVDHDDSAKAKSIRFVKNSPRVHFDPRLCVHTNQCIVDAGKSCDGLSDEIGIARRIDHMKVLFGELEVCRLGLDRVLVIFLFLIEVTNAGAFIDTMTTLDGTGHCQEFVDEGRFS